MRLLLSSQNCSVASQPWNNNAGQRVGQEDADVGVHLCSGGGLVQHRHKDGEEHQRNEE